MQTALINCCVITVNTGLRNIWLSLAMTVSF